MYGAHEKTTPVDALKVTVQLRTAAINNKENMYVKIKEYKRFDEYYIPLKEDDTWKSVLSIIEDVLDDRYFENEEKIPGIKIEFEIVTELPEDIDAEF